MKKFMILFVAVCAFAACKKEVTLESIAVTTQPNKKEYFAGDKFDPAGMVVTATYSDKSTKPVTITASMLSYDFSTAGAKTVTIAYEDKTATVIGITVIIVTVSTLAGNGIDGFVDGAGDEAQFSYFQGGIAVDALGNLYVMDISRIRKITPAGVVSTLAGKYYSGFADGTAENALFNGPGGVAVDASNNIYVADFNRIRKITPEGVVSTLAGNGMDGFNDDTGSAARFYRPFDVAVDIYSNVYVTDKNNIRIRKITPAGVVSTLAGSGTLGFADGTGDVAQFRYPLGIAVDVFGNLYVADNENTRIRKITPEGVVSTLAGSSMAGFADGIGDEAQFSNPIGITVDASGNLYVTDGNRIRKITSAGAVTTIAGDRTWGFADGVGTEARFLMPHGIAVDASGNLYVADEGNKRIRKITIE